MSSLGTSTITNASHRRTRAGGQTPSAALGVRDGHRRRQGPLPRLRPHRQQRGSELRRAEADPAPKELRVALCPRGGRDLQRLRPRPVPLTAQSSRAMNLPAHTIGFPRTRYTASLSSSVRYHPGEVRKGALWSRKMRLRSPTHRRLERGTRRTAPAYLRALCPFGSQRASEALPARLARAGGAQERLAVG